MENKMPWLKSGGTLKSEEEIKRSCKNWSPSVLDELKLREVGERMGITTVSVFRLRDRALKTLGLVLMKRMVSKIPQKKKKIQQFVCERKNFNKSEWYF